MTESNPFEIDKNRLDKECERQPLLMHEMAVNQADEDDRVATAKADLDIVQAEVELLIREDPARFLKNAGAKITESMIDCLVKVSKRYQQALRALNAAKHAAGIAAAGVSAAEHKKRMIEKLVELQGRDYFAAPSGKALGSGYIELPKKKAKKKSTTEEF